MFWDVENGATGIRDLEEYSICLVLFSCFHFLTNFFSLVGYYFDREHEMASWYKGSNFHIFVSCFSFIDFFSFKLYFEQEREMVARLEILKNTELI